MSNSSGPDQPASEPVSGSDDAAADEREVARLRDLLHAGSEGTGGDAFSTLFAVRARVRRIGVAGSVSLCLVAGLVAGLVVLPGGSGRTPPPVVGARTPPPAYRLTGALVSFNGCSEYLDYVRSKALAAVGPYGLQPYVGMNSGNPAFRGSASVTPVAGVGSAPAGVAQNGVAQNGALGAAGSSFSSSPSGTYSQTNDQVAGVDEPDSVKTDGQIVVTLANSTLRVLDSEARVVGSLELSGDTGGGFLLAGDRAIVFSSTSGTGPVPAGVADPAIGPVQQPGSPTTARVTVVDLSNPARPQLVHTFLFGGTVVAARLVGGEVRLVVRTDGPNLNFATPSPVSGQTDTGTATATNRRLIAGSTLDDWLPEWQLENPDGSTTARQPISGCDSVARPQQASGLSTVSVLTLDPASSTPGPGTSIVAAGDVVYETADHIYVAGAVGPTPYPYAEAQQYGCCSVMPPRQASTLIYSFSMSADGTPEFQGGGSVPGWLVNSYAMDEDSNGLLRVASTSQTPDGSSQSQITVLAQTSEQLTAVGKVGGLGRGEFIRAVRFIGDQAYVVTFSSFDPLYVVNLSDPHRPVLAGELDQPGFSEFLYPLPGKRLLGVGVQITDGEPSALLVATYDVSVPAHPRRIDSSVLVSGFQYVAQGFDPHAFLYWPPVGLALVATPAPPPFGAPGGSATGVAAYQIAGDGKLTRIATLGHGVDSADRSIVVGSQVWAVTDAGVVTSELTDLPTTTWHSY